MDGGEQDVEHDRLMAGGGQGGDDVGADEPGSSGDEYAHARDATESGEPGGLRGARRKTFVMTGKTPT
ncbi:hypothetical protein Hesp01_33800 [Herbidospora sp. NBRC 101105]|nr:hypothetical protein Hesp01_33800 [Herbidospora sp. NBRC 101105]